jgi:hypothetical protein
MATNLLSTNFSGGVFEKVGTSTVSGTTVTVDLATGSYFVLDLQGASGTIATFTISNVNAPSQKVRSFQTKIIQGSTARQFNWTGLTTHKWQYYWLPGTGWVHRPTNTLANDAVDVYSFTTYDNGTTWYSSIVGQDIK